MVVRNTIAIFLLISLFALSGCSSDNMKLSQLAKTDIDMVADAHLLQTESLMRELTIKLYKRNPGELKKGARQTVDSRLAQLFNAKRKLQFAETNNKIGGDAMLLAFEPGYAKDRVFALMVGLISMIRTSYGERSEFFVLDKLNAQSLYNSARNIEVLVWRLSTRVAAQGGPLLLTNSLPGESRNLSFERLFGQLISVQDMMALIAAQKWNRTINFIAHQVVFLPVGL